jgi:hypothetical protein
MLCTRRCAAMPKPEDLDETINCVEKRRSDDRGVADVHEPGLNTSQVATAHMTQSDRGGAIVVTNSMAALKRIFG